MVIPEAVNEILQQLNHHGFEAFAVGGCVRDMLLGKIPKDWDITTSASPWQVKEIFRRTIDTGIQHGTVTVMINDAGYEVTTYRIDGEYQDGRHPKEVIFTSDLKEDLCRRDFTINAMAYSDKTGIVDEFGGMEDLKNGIIRCVGNPRDRFREDALRILRAVRFSAQLGFSIESNTMSAIAQIASNLIKISKERIQMELTKLLLSDHPEQMEMVYETGISPYISEAFHQINHKMFGVVPALPRQKHIRWAVFLKNEAPDKAEEVLKDLKMDNDTISRVHTLVSWIPHLIPEEKAKIRRIMSRMEPQLFDDLLKIKKEIGRENAGKLMELTEEIRKNGDCIYLKDLAVTGKDLLETGMKPGKQVGAVLSRLLDDVLEEPGQNQRDILLERAKFYSAPASFAGKK